MQDPEIATDCQECETEQANENQLHKQIDNFEHYVQETFAMLLTNHLDVKAAKYKLMRECFRLKHHLPALAFRRDFEREFLQHRVVVVQGETGSGKSTQLPQFVADMSCFPRGGLVFCVQPRKIAAISLAERVGFEQVSGVEAALKHTNVSHLLSCHERIKPQTTICYVTEACMLQLLINEQWDKLERCYCIILDETHERNVVTDLLMGILKQDNPHKCRISITRRNKTATLDTEAFLNYFRNAPLISIPGRLFPIEYHKALDIHGAPENEGDILCFLPGQAEVEEAAKLFETNAGSQVFQSRFKPKKAAVFALFGRQQPEIQKAALKPVPHDTRKIIFSTDVAETSVTIDGIRFVVDSGICRTVAYDPKRGLSSLVDLPISRSAAIQRAGRSGRTARGVCFRLYSKDDYEAFEFGRLPEIFRIPLSDVVVKLRSLGVDAQQFPWLLGNHPEAEFRKSIAAAEEELRHLGALDSNGQLTEFGRMIPLMGLAPDRARMIYKGAQLGILDCALTLVSVLSVADSAFWRSDELDQQLRRISNEHGDAVRLVRVFEEWARIKRGGTWTPDAAATQSQPKVAELVDDVRAVLLTPRQTAEAQGAEDSSDDEDLDAKSVASFNTDPKKDAEEDEFVSPTMQQIKGKEWLWCKLRSVNRKAMETALATKDEIRSNIKAIRGLRTESERKATDEDLAKLVILGKLTNIAKRKEKSNMFVALGTVVWGVINRNSTVVHCFGQNLPDLVCFDSVFERNTATFSTVTPISELGWLEQESPSFYAVVQKALSEIPTAVLNFEFSTSILRYLIGKQGSIHVPTSVT
eukprot:c20485_g1_i7.p1 GENE.c20485_g1_i7~~c20485_g1_i7.p1  ORF type:complete len:813 (+),score=157.09 c20485_g1_i7:683-3121(+)